MPQNKTISNEDIDQVMLYRKSVNDDGTPRRRKTQREIAALMPHLSLYMIGLICRGVKTKSYKSDV